MKTTHNNKQLCVLVENMISGTPKKREAEEHKIID